MAVVKWRLLSMADKADVPLARHGHKAVSVGKNVVVFGGGRDSLYDDVGVFDTESLEWHRPGVLGPGPGACAAHCMASDGIRHVYVYGGLVEAGHYGSTLYRLDTRLWEWQQLTTTGTSPGPRLGSAMVVEGGSLHVFGGVTTRNHRPAYTNDLHCLDLNTMNWCRIEGQGSAPSPRESHTVVACRSTLVVYGGMNGTRLSDVHVFDLSTHTWHQPLLTGTPPPPRSLHTSSLVGHRMYVFGGWVPATENTWECTNTLAYLDLDTYSWHSFTFRPHDQGVPKARAGHCAAAVDGRLYVWSGRAGSHANSIPTCCRDMWVLETGAPRQSVRVRGAHCTALSLGGQWDTVRGADAYRVQCMVVEGTQPHTYGTPREEEAGDEPVPGIWYEVGYVQRTAIEFSHFHMLAAAMSPASSAGGQDTHSHEECSPDMHEDMHSDTDSRRSSVEVARSYTLQPSTCYSVRVAPVNGCGEGPWGPPTVFTTRPCSAPSVPGPFGFQITRDAINFEWTPPAECGGQAISHYCLDLTVEPCAMQAVPDSAPNRGPVRVYVGPSTRHRLSLSDVRSHLPPHTTYCTVECRLAAANSIGVGPAVTVHIPAFNSYGPPQPIEPPPPPAPVASVPPSPTMSPPHSPAPSEGAVSDEEDGISADGSQDLDQDWSQEEETTPPTDPALPPLTLSFRDTYGTSRKHSFLNPGLKPKRFRRAPDEIDRNFICTHPGCGKGYGSQGALDLHKKTKHDGYRRGKGIHRKKNKLKLKMKRLRDLQRGLQDTNESPVLAS